MVTRTNTQQLGRQGKRRGWLANLSLRPKLVMAYLVVALTPLIILTAIDYDKSSRIVEESSLARSRDVAKEHASLLATEIERVRQLSGQLAAAQATRLRGATDSQKEDFITNIVWAMPAVSRTLLIDSNSQMMVSVPRVSAANALKVPDSATNGQIASAIGRNDDQQPQFQIFVPIRARGAVEQIVVVQAEFRGLVTLAELPNVDEGAAVTVVQSDGKVLYSSRPGWESDLMDKVIQEPAIEAASRGQVSAAWSSATLLGDVFYGAAAVQGTDWVVIYSTPGVVARREIDKHQAEELRNVAVAAGLVLLLAVAISLLFSRQLLVPIMAITQVMNQVRSGRYNARVPELGGDELGVLSQNLNTTLDEVVSLIQSRDERDALQIAVRDLLNQVSEVASGNLSVQAEVTAGPTGAITDGLNYMIEELRGLVQRTQATADQVSTEAAGVTALTEQLAASATGQRRRLDEARDSVNEMTVLMTKVRQSVDDSVTATGDARTAVETGQQAVTETVSAIGRLRTETRETAAKIKRLGESSQEIGQITRLIDEIADQTHLLALNASIQAAMAGEHGRGFAVVAEEVRALAERSAAATGKIEELVRVIQDDANAAMVAMERSTQEVVTGSRLADRAGGALTAIGEVTDRIVTLSGQIERLVVTQFSAAETLEVAVTEVAGATNKTTEDVRVVAAGMQSLAHLSAELRESISVFTIEAEDVTESMEAAA